MSKRVYPTAAAGQQFIRDLQQQRDSLARPAKVLRAEFIRRNLKADIAAGRCTVSIVYPQKVAIVDLIHKGGDYYSAILADGREIFAGKGEMDVEWQPQPVKLWQPIVMPHPLDTELHPSIEPAFTWQRHPAAVCYNQTGGVYCGLQ